MFLIAVGSHSMWLEVEIMSSTISGRNIDRLRNIFSHYGLLEQLVSNNSPQLVSFEFKQFTKENGMRQYGRKMLSRDQIKKSASVKSVIP